MLIYLRNLYRRLPHFRSWLFLCQLHACFLLLTHDYILSEDLILNDMDIALIIEVTSKQSRVLRFAIDVHVDVKLLIKIVEIESKSVREKIGVLYWHH